MGSRGNLDQDSVKHSGPQTLSNSKTAFMKSRVPFGVCVQRKLDMDGKDFNKNTEFIQDSVKQPKYQSPARNNPSSIYPPGRSSREVTEATEKLSSMTISAGRQTMGKSLPPPMKAGGWHSRSHMFLGQFEEIQPNGNFTRKIAE